MPLGRGTAPQGEEWRGARAGDPRQDPARVGVGVEQVGQGRARFGYLVDGRTTSAVGANELSKGALRAMRAQSRQTSTPSVAWTECSSRASLAPSRDVSPATFEGDFAYPLPHAESDLQTDMPYAETGLLGFDWAQHPVQQTYAYPEGRLADRDVYRG